MEIDGVRERAGGLGRLWEKLREGMEVVVEMFPEEEGGKGGSRFWFGDQGEYARALGCIGAPGRELTDRPFVGYSIVRGHHHRLVLFLDLEGGRGHGGERETLRDAHERRRT